MLFTNTSRDELRVKIDAIQQKLFLSSKVDVRSIAAVAAVPVGFYQPLVDFPDCYQDEVRNED